MSLLNSECLYCPGIVRDMLGLGLSECVSCNQNVGLDVRNLPPLERARAVLGKMWFDCYVQRQYFSG